MQLYQQLTADERSKITIDGEPTVEIDLKSSHLMILYALNKQPLPEGDLYDVEGIPRALVKVAITKMMGLGHPKFVRWPNWALAELRSGELLGYPLNDKERLEHYPVEGVTRKILRKHPVLNSLEPIHCDWGKLQFMESEVIIATMLDLLERGGFGVLSVHDSIIVPKSIQPIAMAALSSHFTRIIGLAPRLEVK